MLAYDADLELFRDNFKRFMNEHVAPYYEEWEREGMMPRSVWNAMGENGFLCVDVRRIWWLRCSDPLFPDVNRRVSSSRL